MEGIVDFLFNISPLEFEDIVKPVKESGKGSRKKIQMYGIANSL